MEFILLSDLKSSSIRNILCVKLLVKIKSRKRFLPAHIVYLNYKLSFDQYLSDSFLAISFYNANISSRSQSGNIDGCFIILFHQKLS